MPYVYVNVQHEVTCTANCDRGQMITSVGPGGNTYGPCGNCQGTGEETVTRREQVWKDA